MASGRGARCRVTVGSPPPLVAALAPDGLHEPWLIEGAMETATFEWDITQELAPTRRPGQVVVLETVSVHPAERLPHAREARQGQHRFFRPSSPHCTPIEHALSALTP